MYKLVHENRHLNERELCRVIADKSPNPDVYHADLIAAVLSFQHHVVFEEYEDNNQILVRQVHLAPLPPNQGFSAYKLLSGEVCKGVYNGELDPVSASPRVAAPPERDDSEAPSLEADFSTGRRPDQCTCPQLKAYLVNRGIPIPSTMTKKAQFVELIDKLQSYPAGTFRVVQPWSSHFASWCRADPVSLSANNPIAGEALFSLVRSTAFPDITEDYVKKFMPDAYANTRERGHQLYENGLN